MVCVKRGEVAEGSVLLRGCHRGEIRLVPVRFEVPDLEDEIERAPEALFDALEQAHHRVHLPVDVAHGGEGDEVGALLHGPMVNAGAFAPVDDE